MQRSEVFRQALIDVFHTFTIAQSDILTIGDTITISTKWSFITKLFSCSCSFPLRSLLLLWSLYVLSLTVSFDLQ